MPRPRRSDLPLRHLACDAPAASRRIRARPPIPDVRRNCEAVSSTLLSLLSIAADEGVGGTVMFELRLSGAFQLGDDSLGEDLAQLDAPLVERIDIPPRALGNHAVLVQRHQLAQRLGRQFLGNDRRRWTIAFENAMRHQPLWRPLGLDLLRGLAEGQRLALRDDVGDQNVVKAPERIKSMA